MVKIFLFFIFFIFFSCNKFTYNRCFVEKSKFDISETEIDTNTVFILDFIESNDKYNQDFIELENELIQKLKPVLKFSNNGSFSIINLTDISKIDKKHPIGYYNIFEKNKLKLCQNSYSVQGGWFVSKSILEIVNDSILKKKSESKNSTTTSYYKKTKINKN